MDFKLLISSIAILSIGSSAQEGNGGYSYNRFSGPVSGQIQQIQVEAGQGQAATQYADFGYDHKTGQINPETQKYAHYKTVDYVAKPDYQYAYGVEDPHTGNNQKHKETRDGDVVRGEYSLVEADGTIRTVKYTADSKNGFQATVHTEPGTGGGNQQSTQNDFGNNDDRNDNQYNDYNDYNNNNYNGNNNYNDNRNNNNRNNINTGNRNNNNYNNNNRNNNNYRRNSNDGDYY